jgi:glycosyltransferase involved in cell wall biosynthesis
VRILASSLAHSSKWGSESLVGYRAVEALGSRHDVTLVTAAGMEESASGRCETVPVRFDDPNDVSTWQLLRFERQQQRLIARLLREQQFDVVHRVTPSGLKDSLLPVPPVPLVIGPILLARPHPAEFDAIFRPVLRGAWFPRAMLHRLQHGAARRAFRRWSTLEGLLDHATLILAGSRTTLGRLPLRLSSRCRVITYSGVEHDVFCPAAQQPQKQVATLLFVGRMVPYKGVELLLRAAAQARTSRRLVLKIVGQGSETYRRYCMDLATALGLGDSVQFVTRQSREALVEAYRTADVFCMPSIETYGIAILEAMSCGCAVLASDYNGPGEIVQSGTGLKVALETPEQFVSDYAERLVELIDDQQLRHELGEAARENVVKNHDWSQIQRQLLDCYEEVSSALSQLDLGIDQRTWVARPESSKGVENNEKPHPSPCRALGVPP